MSPPLRLMHRARVTKAMQRTTPVAAPAAIHPLVFRADRRATTLRKEPVQARRVGTVGFRRVVAAAATWAAEGKALVAAVAVELRLVKAWPMRTRITSRPTCPHVHLVPTRDRATLAHVRANVDAAANGGRPRARRRPVPCRRFPTSVHSTTKQGGRCHLRPGAVPLSVLHLCSRPPQVLQSEGAAWIVLLQSCTACMDAFVVSSACVQTCAVVQLGVGSLLRHQCLLHVKWFSRMLLHDPLAEGSLRVIRGSHGFLTCTAAILLRLVHRLLRLVQHACVACSVVT